MRPTEEEASSPLPAPDPVAPEPLHPPVTQAAALEVERVRLEDGRALLLFSWEVGG